MEKNYKRIGSYMKLVDKRNKDLAVTVGKHLFVKLLEYYKTIDAEGAAFYWNEYDRDDE